MTMNNAFFDFDDDTFTMFDWLMDDDARKLSRRHRPGQTMPDFLEDYRKREVPTRDKNATIKNLIEGEFRFRTGFVTRKGISRGEDS